MSRSYACGQFERNYKAVRLCNWEVSAERARPLKPTSSKPPAKTEFIASDNGHLLGRSSMLKAPPPWQRPSAAPATPQPLVILGGLAIPWGGEEAGPLPARASRLPKPLVPPPLTMQGGRCRPRSSRAMMRCRPTGGPTIGSRATPHMAAVPLWGTGELRGGGTVACPPRHWWQGISHDRRMRYLESPALLFAAGRGPYVSPFDAPSCARPRDARVRERRRAIWSVKQCSTTSCWLPCSSA